MTGPVRPSQEQVEKDRKALIRHWEGQPSPNPDFRGKTPRDVARALLRSVSRRVRDRSSK